MKKLFLVWLSYWLMHPLAAQQLQLITYDIDEGLSRGLIKSVITDDIGFVWSATDEGLIRFDGRHSAFFRNALPGGFAKSFYQRAEGQFLVAHDHGLLEIFSRPDTTYFREFLAGLSTDTDTALYYPKIMYEDQGRNLWIGEQQSVVKYIDGQIKKYRFGPEDRAASFERNFSFSEDGEGNLWVASYNGNLYLLDQDEDRFLPVDLSVRLSEVSFLMAADSNRLLLGARQGLFVLTVDAAQKRVVSDQIGDMPRVSSGIRINDHEFYVGTFDNGLFRTRLDDEKMESVPVSPLPFPDIMNLYFDENGLWVCSSEAIGLLHPVFFGKFHVDGEIDQVSSLKLGRDSTIVMANGGQVFLLRPAGDTWEADEVVTFPGDKAALQAVQTERGVWIGGFTGEVYYYDFTAKKLETIQGITRHHDFLVSDILEDRNGNIWVCGNRQDGMIRITPGRRVIKYADAGLINNRVIDESPSGELFCAGSGADSYLFRYEADRDRFRNISVGLPFQTDGSFVVYDLFFENDQALLLGTSHGLLRYHRGDSTWIERIDLGVAPIEEAVQAIERTPDRALWVATTWGLVKYEKGNALLFDPTSGLPSRTLKPHAMITDFNGDLWVGTARGLALYKGDELRRQFTTEPIFTDLKINGRKVNPQNGDLGVFPNRSTLEVSYIALSFPGDRIKYQYRIPEQDTNWSAPISNTQLFFTSLDAGIYTFQVRAQQSGGLLWSAPRSFAFEIAPPWYQRWWALLLFVAVGTGLYIVAVRLHNLRLIRHKKQLERLVAKRTEEIQQQNDKIITQKNEIIRQKEELIRQGELVLQTQMALSSAERKNRRLKEKQLQQALERKNKQLTTVSLRIIQKNKTLKELGKKIGDISGATPKINRDLRKLQKLIDESFRLDKDWDEFKLYFEQVYVDFYQNLHERYPDLTNTELRHCALIKLNLSISECANILGISPESVKISRFRLKKKMNLETQNEVRDEIMSI